MFDLFRNKRINKYTINAEAYIRKNYVEPPKDNGIRYSLNVDNPPQNNYIKYSRETDDDQYADVDLSDRPRYSLNTEDNFKYSDRYSQSSADSYLRRSLRVNDDTLLRNLHIPLNDTFVEKVMTYIREKGLNDATVYKAAQVDRRLFSKMMTDRQYKPSKDTAIAIAAALKLTEEQTSDLLSRAGYTFSHSNKRDVIIEFFFRERINSLTDMNLVLDKLGQKPIGR